MNNMTYVIKRGQAKPTAAYIAESPFIYDYY